MIVFSLRRSGSRTPRYASLFLLLALLMTLGSGLAWSVVGQYRLTGFSGVSWHINVGVVLVPVFVWHTIYQTKGFPLSFWADRRSFLRLTGVAAAGLAAWQLAEIASRLGRTNAPNRRFTGSYEADSFSGNDFPRTSWLNDKPERVDLDRIADRWRLKISGAVNREISLSHADLDGAATTTATLDCTGGWYSTKVWTGTPVADLLKLSGWSESAASV
ncbi:MAG: molybdopterin-dependent oxidoreductase, partial [Chloroflexi bacterium]|nr:molybdopterin-dependent oxidoreductase [Chloroflexota bacterium]